MEKAPCCYPDCQSRLSSKYKDGRNFCRKHLGEITEIDDWIDHWIANYRSKV